MTVESHSDVVKYRRSNTDTNYLSAELSTSPQTSNDVQPYRGFVFYVSWLLDLSLRLHTNTLMEDNLWCSLYFHNQYLRITMNSFHWSHFVSTACFMDYPKKSLKSCVKKNPHLSYSCSVWPIKSRTQNLDCLLLVFMR